MAIARFVNFPDTLAALGYPVPWDPEHFLKVMNGRKTKGEVCFSPATTSAMAARQLRKRSTLCNRCLLRSGDHLRQQLRPRDDDALHSFYGRLKDMPGFASFMAGQVVADLMYVAPFKHAPDWMTFAVPGPGSKRGLIVLLVGRWMHRGAMRTHGGRRSATARTNNARARAYRPRGFARCRLTKLSCEFDKMERVRLGEGKLTGASYHAHF